MNVLHVIGGVAPRYGGPSEAVTGMAKALAARGHRVEIFTTNVDGPGTLDVAVGVPLEVDGFRITHFPVQRPRSYVVSIPLARALARRAAEFDVVHVHSLYLFHSLVTPLVCRTKRIPYVVRPHGTLNPYHRRAHRSKKAVYEALVERRNLNAAAAIHYTSETERRHAEEAGVRAPGLVVPLAVDAELYERAHDMPRLLDRHPELGSRELVTFLGRLSAKKGLDLLVDAFARVAAARPNAHLVIAGPDDEGLGEALAARVERLGLRDRVSFVGIVTDEKPALLQRSRVFVLPSEDENFAVTVVEAMAAATPVVVTEGVAIHDEVRDARAGLVVDRSPEAIAEGVLRVLADEREAAALGAGGRELVRSSFSWNRRGPELEAMYEQAVRTATRP